MLNKPSEGYFILIDYNTSSNSSSDEYMLEKSNIASNSFNIAYSRD